jgi:Rps23 Pro-64 3,4-dihydroxylase Tpa1-like proline 4-hydroxylase
MTSSRIFDASSDSLMQDERILGPRERELLTSLLQTAGNAYGDKPEIQTAIRAVIAQAVGETVAQRAFTLLGGTIVEQILAQSTATSGKEVSKMRRVVFSGPQPPNTPQPGPGGDDDGDDGDGPVKPSGPEPPNVHLERPGTAARTTARVMARAEQSVQTTSVELLDKPEVALAQCVVLDEFLAPQEVEQLIRYALEHEKNFRTSEVISPDGVPGVTNSNHRRSRVLMDAGPFKKIILNRIRHTLPEVLQRLGMAEFPITRSEVQITASNDQDFFRAHSDDGQAVIDSRRLTFVYFSHREPKQFEGGELWLHDSRKGEHHAIGTGSYERIIPQQNQIVFFPCSTLHEITPVRCESRAFADSRFTVNGWLHR